MIPCRRDNRRPIDHRAVGSRRRRVEIDQAIEDPDPPRELVSPDLSPGSSDLLTDAAVRHTDEGQDLAPGQRSGRKTPSMRLVTMLTPGLVDAARRHALVAGSMTTATPCGFSTWSRVLAICAVTSPGFAAASHRLEEARELPDPDDAVARQIGDMHPADDRRHMVFAMALSACPSAR